MTTTKDYIESAITGLNEAVKRVEQLKAVGFDPEPHLTKLAKTVDELSDELCNTAHELPELPEESK